MTIASNNYLILWGNMDRSTVTTIARANGAKLHSRDVNTGWYLFRSEAAVYRFREMIPFNNLFQGEFGDGYMLIVYFDQIA